MKYTPGPWELSRDGMGNVWIKGHDVSGNIVCREPDMPKSKAFWPDNAKLIMAAPEMYELLKKIDAVWSRNGRKPNILGTPSWYALRRVLERIDDGVSGAPVNGKIADYYAAVTGEEDKHEEL